METLQGSFDAAVTALFAFGFLLFYLSVRMARTGNPVRIWK